MPRGKNAEHPIAHRLPPEFKTDCLKLSERDSLRVLDLLKNPPAPPERLKRVARAANVVTTRPG